MAWGNVENTDFGFNTFTAATTAAADIASLNPASGNGLVAVIAVRSDITISSVPAGWSLVAAYNSVSTNPDFHIYEKIADGTEGVSADPIWSWTTARQGAVWSFKFRGTFTSVVDQTNADFGTGNNTSPSITPAGQVGNVFSILMDVSGEDAPVVPSGMTLVKQEYLVTEDDEHSCAFVAHTTTDATGDYIWGTVADSVGALTFNVLDGAYSGIAQAEGFAPTLDPIDVHAQVGRVNVIGDIKGISYSPRRAQLGQAQATVGGTGAALEIVVQIEPPASWFGTVNLEGPITTGTAVSGLLGQTNVEGFAATFPTKDVHPQTGLVNVEGIASNERTISATNGTAQATAGTVALIEFAGEFARKPQVGYVNTYRLGETATVEAIKTIEGPTVGETNATGAAAIIDLDSSFSKVGNVNAEGFAPSITSAKVVTIEAGSINAQGFAPVGDTSVDVVASVGIANIEGKTSTVFPEGTGFVSGSLGEANATGFAPTLDAQRTTKPSVGRINIIGYAPAVAGGENVVSLIRNTHVIGFAGFVSSSGWIPISQNQQSWAPASGASSTWSTIDADNTSTWTEIQEAS